MSGTLGVLVSSDRHMDLIIGLCRSARKKGLGLSIFFTHTGTKLTRHPRFPELAGLARMSICKVGFEDNRLTAPVPGIKEKDYSTQARNAELIEECDRYVAF